MRADGEVGLVLRLLRSFLAGVGVHVSLRIVIVFLRGIGRRPMIGVNVSSVLFCVALGGRVGRLAALPGWRCPLRSRRMLGAG